MEQSYLRFSIEESVWFKRGQEVSEFISISLDPIISVEEYEQYITIRGVLELSGEYQMAEDEEEREYSDGLSAHRLIQEVIIREDGVSELIHHFPVDITIPKNRIESLEDVYVTIESFDYDLEEHGRLLLTADISISGIYSSSQPSEANMEESSDELEVVQRSEEYEETIKEDEEKQEETEDLFDPFEVIARKEAYQENIEEMDEELDEDREAVPMHVELKSRKEEVLETETNEAVNHEQQIEISQAEKKVSKRNENALYLTKIFAKEEHQDFSRLKICIVQQGDSLDKIADRYDVSVQQLLRVNKLEHESDIYEGQLLYIPVSVVSKT
ncbi:stage VI sporulation protein D [Anoxybacillus vitaminiphilus]|uniref:Stage VI sporulation protein D n=1 Tax=Paranoxybacillus vitaminiphilus TaxID=581036 RepID=A0A327YMC8_9BACL|nr:stage VI sporulation protein D [Anoxybacillus vitaminiphilus]RAK21366.1 stage VI sporulation protein D [Anoxybacillus vitaminiphilus]